MQRNSSLKDRLRHLGFCSLWYRTASGFPQTQASPLFLELDSLHQLHIMLHAHFWKCPELVSALVASLEVHAKCGGCIARLPFP